MLRPDLYKTVRADADGTFVISGIAPGAYRLFAWKEMSGNLFFDPDFLKRFTPAGIPLKLSAGTTTRVDLVVMEQ